MHVNMITASVVKAMSSQTFAPFLRLVTEVLNVLFSRNVTFYAALKSIAYFQYRVGIVRK